VESVSSTTTEVVGYPRAKALNLMNTIQTTLPGVVIIEPKVFGDARGFFMETWNRPRYEAAGLPGGFIQDNISSSRKGVLRGLHYQKPFAQGKLLSVFEGEIFDVAVDIRRGSPDFGRWVGVLLSSENRRQLYVPPGFAHGFCVVSDRALVTYKCTEVYHPEADHGVRWDDPRIGIDWPVTDPAVSDKDRRAPLLDAIAPGDLPEYP
jgi:dTDP-4-dehydrorhamnose 3,5-epimerase